ncbi:CTR copper uptake transporter [Daedaleopsis nitida]|nr:CTR copper uptake transporter [Daedaleopsis nitida]
MLAPLVVSAVFASGVLAHSNGMDMDMDGDMALASGSMVPWLHFAPGDILLFYGWVPTSVGAMVGTCIGLFLLGLVDRWLAATRAVMGAHWNKRAQIALANKINVASTGEKPSAFSAARIRDVATMRNGLPFIPAHDIPRGILHGLQAALSFALMLIVMTFQAAFIISIVVGLGVGEALFGRYSSHAGQH